MQLHTFKIVPNNINLAWGQYSFQNRMKEGRDPIDGQEPVMGRVKDKGKVGQNLLLELFTE